MHNNHGVDTDDSEDVTVTLSGIPVDQGALLFNNKTGKTFVYDYSSKRYNLLPEDFDGLLLVPYPNIGTVKTKIVATSAERNFGGLPAVVKQEVDFTFRYVNRWPSVIRPGGVASLLEDTFFVFNDTSGLRIYVTGA